MEKPKFCPLINSDCMLDRCMAWNSGACYEWPQTMKWTKTIVTKTETQGESKMIKELNKKFSKISFKAGVVLALAGVCITIAGATIGDYYTIRLSGVIVSAGGLLIMANRLYARIKGVAKYKASTRPQRLAEAEAKLKALQK